MACNTELTFLDLPPEVRSTIYGYALGGHIVSYPYGRGFKESQSKATADRIPAGKAPEGKPSSDDTDQITGLIALLLSCRTIEALPLLYSTNTFHVKSHHLFSDVDTNTQTRHINRIRALRLDTAELPATAAFLRATPLMVLDRVHRLLVNCCGRPGRTNRGHIPHGFKWKELWAVVREMRALSDIEVWVCGGPVPAGWQKAVLEPMAEVRGVSHFRVWVPWDIEAVEQHRRTGLPFSLDTYGGPAHDSQLKQGDLCRRGLPG